MARRHGRAGRQRDDRGDRFNDLVWIVRMVIEVIDAIRRGLGG